MLVAEITVIPRLFSVEPVAKAQQSDDENSHGGESIVRCNHKHRPRVVTHHSNTSSHD